MTSKKQRNDAITSSALSSGNAWEWVRESNITYALPANALLHGITLEMMIGSDYFFVLSEFRVCSTNPTLVLWLSLWLYLQISINI